MEIAQRFIPINDVELIDITNEAVVSKPQLIHVFGGVKNPRGYFDFVSRSGYLSKRFSHANLTYAVAKEHWLSRVLAYPNSNYLIDIAPADVMVFGWSRSPSLHKDFDVFCDKVNDLLGKNSRVFVDISYGYAGLASDFKAAQIIEPTLEKFLLQEIYENVKDLDYEVIHYRTGDKFLVGKQPGNLDSIVAKINSKLAEIEKPCALVTDNEELKALFAHKLAINRYKAAHSQADLNLTVLNILSWAYDIITIQKSSKVNSFNLESSFCRVPAQYANIPIDFIK